MFDFYFYSMCEKNNFQGLYLNPNAPFSPLKPLLEKLLDPRLSIDILIHLALHWDSLSSFSDFFPANFLILYVE